MLGRTASLPQATSASPRSRGMFAPGPTGSGNGVVTRGDSRGRDGVEAKASYLGSKDASSCCPPGPS